MTVLDIRYAEREDAETILAIMQSVARWLATDGPGALWSPDSFTLPNLTGRIIDGEVVVITVDGLIAGSLYLQAADALFWPEDAPGEALYVHKLVVSRQHAGQGFSHLLLDWAAQRARMAGCGFLRLDCPPRARLVQNYVAAGFTKVGDDVVVEGFTVSRLERKLGDGDRAGIAAEL